MTDDLHPVEGEGHRAPVSRGSYALLLGLVLLAFLLTAIAVMLHHPRLGRVRGDVQASPVGVVLA